MIDGSSRPNGQGEHSKRHPIGKYCVTVPIILGAIYAVIRVMLYCVWVSDHAVEVGSTTSKPREARLTGGQTAIH